MGYAAPDDAKSRDAFLVDTEVMGHEQRESACRVALRAVGADAVCFESDIPGGSRRAEWTSEHHAAVNELLWAGRTIVGRHRLERSGYAQTGILPVGDTALWEAFVTVAPHAFDASVWATRDTDQEPIVQISDESQSIFVRLTPAQHAEVIAVIGSEGLVPYQRRRL